jgi:hypothetical protein
MLHTVHVFRIPAGTDVEGQTVYGRSVGLFKEKGVRDEQGLDNHWIKLWILIRTTSQLIKRVRLGAETASVGTTIGGSHPYYHMATTLLPVIARFQALNIRCYAVRECQANSMTWSRPVR